MKQTKGAIGNLLNRYRAVLKKCHLLNTFGSLAVAGMLVMGGASVALAVDGTWTRPDGTQEAWFAGTVIGTDDTVLSGTYEGAVSDENNTAGVAAINYGISGVTVADGTIFRNNAIAAEKGAAGGALKILSSVQIGNNVTFEENKAIENGGWGGGALYIKTTDGKTPDAKPVSIGNNAHFYNNQAKTWGGAIALEYGNLTIGDGAIFRGNSTTATFAEAAESGGGAIAVWHDPSNGNPVSNLTVHSALFEGNSTTVGGGAIYNKDGQVTVDNNTVFRNNSSVYHGGAISNESGRTDIAGKIIVSNSLFENNTSGNGGAIWQGSDGEAEIKGSIFTGNTALTGEVQQGGAITNAGIMTVAMSEFSGNEAGKIGGAIANVDPANGDSFVNNNLKLENINVHDNWAGESGGGIYNSANQTINFTGTNTIVDNHAGENRTADDLHNAGEVNINDGSTTVAAITNETNATITVAAENTAATFTITQSWTGEGTVEVKGLGTFAVNKDVILDADNTVKEGLTQATLEDGAIYKINGLDGESLSIEDLNKIRTDLIGEESQGLVNFGNITISDIKTTDCGAGDHIAYVPNSGITSTAYTADVTSVQNSDGINGAFKSIHLTDTTDALIAKGNLNLAGSSRENIALVMGQDGSTGSLRIGSGTGGVDGQTSVVTLGDETQNNHGSLNGVAMNAGTGHSATLKVVGNGDAYFSVGDLSTDVSNNTVWVVGAHLTTNSIASHGGTQILNKLSVNNGSVTTNGTAKIEDIDLADGSTFATKATDAENSGAITVTGKVTGQGEVSADKSLTFEKGLTTGEEDNLRLAAGTEEFTGTVSFAGALDSTVGTVQIDADTLSVTGTTTLVEDSVKAGQWEPNGEISAKDSLVQVGQFGNDENGASSLNQSLALNGTTLFVHGDTTPETVAAAQAAVSTLRPEGAAYYTNKTLNLAETNGTLAAGSVELGSNKVAFGADSLLVVDSSALDKGQAFTYGTATGAGEATASVAEGAKLHAVNVQHGQNVVIFGEGFVQGMDTVAGWDTVTTDTPMLTASYDNASNSLSVTAENAREIYPDLSDEMAALVTQYYIEGLNTTGKGAGSEFLRRATHGDHYLAGDRKAAASTIESAARIAFAGAVPQMTKMASDAATNAVVNRLGFANPENGAKAMNVDGKLVDDKALGLALWIAPLWSNQTGFGMEAGNLDYGYNANLGGVSLGADYTWANNFRAGLMFNIGGGYAESAGGDLSETTNSMTFWGVGAYGGWEYNNFAVMADVSYTSTWNSVDQDLDHRMGMGDLEADIQASAISAGLRFEYKLETQYLDLIPHVGARYMSINTWGYDVDSSMGTILESDGFQQNIWTFPVGITFSKELEMNNDWYFKPSVDFTVIPAAGDIKAKEDVRFRDVPISAELETQMMDYFTWQGGVGLEFGNDNMSVGVNYTLQAGQNSTGHGVFGMFRYEF